MNTIKNAFNIGVDVGKHRLDFFCHESGEYFRVANTPKGIRMALKQLKPLSISRLVVEATGRHEQALVLAATRQRNRWWLLNLSPCDALLEL
jgi:transposase